MLHISKFKVKLALVETTGRRFAASFYWFEQRSP